MNLHNTHNIYKIEEIICSNRSYDVRCIYITSTIDIVYYNENKNTKLGQIV